ncbi:hypothetical protein [Porphyromonas gingivicanis]|uniref:hypothetical protein n=1 Tax=Porphyromonas gingivicanis TaxID=266762 RepID=UPI000470363A|nr:hypothetical protein [Porphyromonas gingivicanis]
MITVRALILFERLSGRSYRTLGAEEQDTLLLSYSMQCAKGRCELTYEDYLVSLREANPIREQATKACERAIRYIAQFMQDEATVDTLDGEPPTQLPTLTELALSLIARGISPDFVLDRMDLWLFAPLFKQIALKEQEVQENKRLWAFVHLSPYHQKGAKPTDLIVFPWEAEQVQKERDETAEQSIEDFELLTQE